jgi:hypothetical protein
MPLRAGLGGLAVLVLAMFFDVLFVPGPRVLGIENTDLGLHFLHWRRFGFGELASGNLALWNPHIYAGVPFFGGMQSALLYPPNWLFLVLPLPLAANLSIALNVWLLGAFVYLWALRRALHPFAAFVAAALAMFCAPHFLRVYAGHVAGMASMAWTPLVFLAIDAWIESRRPGWLLVGMAAVAMQVFAGHPQTVYLTGLMAALYSLFRMRIAGAAGIFAGGAALAAVQLLTGFQAAAETIRDRPMTFEMAKYFSFPTENFVTLVAPGFFGDVSTHPYWGRWYLWEASAFIGVAGLALAVYGMAGAKLAGKRALLATAGVAALLALGDNTPLFPVLFDWLPWFSRFRGAGKFIFITALILVLFAGAGMDRILRERGVPRRAVWAAGAGALALGAAGMLIPTLDWRPVAATILMTGQTYFEHERYLDRGFLSASRSFAALGLMLAALTLAAVAGLLLWTRKEPRAALVLGLLAVAEVFAYARLYRPTFDSSRIVIPELAEFLARNPGDYRILSLVQPNSAISMKAFDAWGYDPGITRRYAEFINWSAGGDPEKPIAHVNFHQFHPLLALVRVKYIVAAEGDVLSIHPGAVPPLGRLELITSHEVHAGRTAILQAMAAPGFDPLKRVILEREPRPAPVAGGKPGRARILREGSDFMEIEADLEQPSVLLVTDAWTPAWRAVPLEAGDARRYELMPANYILRAVALDRGRHRLRLEYAPGEFRLGAAISILALAAWLGAGAWLARRRGAASA